MRSQLACVAKFLKNGCPPGKFYLLINLLFLIAAGANAQNRVTVRGIVNDDKGNPISNASVLVKGTTNGVTTDANGTFTISVPDNKSVLVISNIGYTSKEVVVGNNTSLTIDLTPQANSLNEVVVVGYGTQKKVTVTGSVAQVSGKELEKTPTVNLSNALVGRLPGISAVQSSGEPGYDGSSIRIRGTNTFGNTSALIVVDGVPDVAGGLERLNPADIETMSVLKDASAAIYGSRAANGVILITTKHGKSGKPRLSYNYNHGWAQPTRVPKMADAVEYAQMNNETTIFDGVPSDEWTAANEAFKTTGTYTTNAGKVVRAPFQPDDIQKYKDGSDPWGHPNTDWYKTTLKTWSPQEQHSLQINGGTESVKYLASLGYQNQDGYYKNSATGYKQYDMRINLDAKVNKWISTGINLTARQEFRHFPTESANSIFRMLQRGRPTDPEVWPNGLPGPDIENGQNPIVITTNQTGYDDDKRNYFQVNGRVEILIPWVKGLKLTGTATADKEIRRVKTWRTPWYLYFWDHQTYEADGVTPLLTKNLRSTYTSPQLNQSDENYLNILTSGFINYDGQFGGHSIAVMAAVTKEVDKEDDFNAYRTNFISPALDQMFAGGTQGQQVGGAGYERARLSYFGRVAYNYKEKYLAEFLWREDGSYLFPENHRFGFFPGFLAGWRISEEKFFSENIHFINSLKIRGSYGELGNDQVYYGGSLREYQFLSTYGFSSYTINNTAFKTLFEQVVPNPSFTWEVARNTDVGIEGTMLDNRINFEFDYFYNKRDQILWPKSGSTPQTSGIANLLPPTNIGKAENKGYDFTVGYNGNVKDFRFTVSVNGGYARNKILFQDEPPGGPSWQKATGHPFASGGGGAFLPYLYDGVFKDQADIDKNTIDYSGLTPSLKPGDMKYKDIGGRDANGNYVKKPDGKINGDDRVRLDKTQQPTFTGGVNIYLGYKDFDLSVLFQGASGGLLYIGTESGDIGNYLKYAYDHRWTIDNPSSVDPRIANRGNTYYSGGNTYFLRNSDYFRLKNVELGYNLPAKLLDQIKINAFRVYVSGLNLATWDKMKIWDPESTSGDAHYYPQARIINVGARVTF
jgi:TonB-linked SusC/RagA family outer membrane protein